MVITWDMQKSLVKVCKGRDLAPLKGTVFSTTDSARPT